MPFTVHHEVNRAQGFVQISLESASKLLSEASKASAHLQRYGLIIPTQQIRERARFFMNKLVFSFLFFH